MARQRRGQGEQQEDLNLAPMMNLVIILIPMLLLSVVFLEVSVINITAPNLSVGGPPKPVEQEEDKKEPLNLTVAVSVNGFQIAATGANAPAVSGCPTQGPTICLEDDKVDVAAKFEEARNLMAQDQDKAGEDKLKEALAAYNFRELYNYLIKIKNEYPEETIINLSSDGDIPFAALVRVMDVARFKLEQDSYSSTTEFWQSKIVREGGQPVELFSDPVLTVVK